MTGYVLWILACGSGVHDLKKAFDTVDHKTLFKKLEIYGVQQREHSWFKSYLPNQKLFCGVNCIDSKNWGIVVGVPQGSCIGPLLFPIHINSLPQAVRECNVFMNADDSIFNTGLMI